MRILRMKDVTEKIGLGKTTLYKMIEQGRFPRPFPLNGSEVLTSPVGWLESDVDAWILERHSAAQPVEH